MSWRETQFQRFRLSPFLPDFAGSRPKVAILAHLAHNSSQLQWLPANAGLKVQLARRLPREATMSLKLAARQMRTGSREYLSNLMGQAAPDPGQLGPGV